MKFSTESRQALEEVQFYFCLKVEANTHTLALISRYGEPDVELFRESFRTLVVCEYRGDHSFEVIQASHIQAAVTMVPFHPLGAPPPGGTGGRLKEGC